jgi:hypothetical protein
LKTSLRRLLDLPIQRIFFAHGNPINSSAQALLRPLLS